jgi:hypothetical protein
MLYQNRGSHDMELNMGPILVKTTTFDFTIRKDL